MVACVIVVWEFCFLRDVIRSVLSFLAISEASASLSCFSNKAWASWTSADETSADSNSFINASKSCSAVSFFVVAASSDVLAFSTACVVKAIDCRVAASEVRRQNFFWTKSGKSLSFSCDSSRLTFSFRRDMLMLASAMRLVHQDT